MASYEPTIYHKQKTIYCKVCGSNVIEWQWHDHVKEEKIRFCKAVNLDVQHWRDVNWWNVIKFFNPTNYKLYHNPEVQLNLKGEVVKNDV